MGQDSSISLIFIVEVVIRSIASTFDFHYNTLLCSSRRACITTCALNTTLASTTNVQFSSYGFQLHRPLPSCILLASTARLA